MVLWGTRLECWELGRWGRALQPQVLLLAGRPVAGWAGGLGLAKVGLASAVVATRGLEAALVVGLKAQVTVKVGVGGVAGLVQRLGAGAEGLGVAGLGKAEGLVEGWAAEAAMGVGAQQGLGEGGLVGRHEARQPQQAAAQLSPWPEAAAPVAEGAGPAAAPAAAVGLLWVPPPPQLAQLWAAEAAAAGRWDWLGQKGQGMGWAPRGPAALLVEAAALLAAVVR